MVDSKEKTTITTNSCNDIDTRRSELVKNELFFISKCPASLSEVNLIDAWLINADNYLSIMEKLDIVCSGSLSLKDWGSSVSIWMKMIKPLKLQAKFFLKIKVEQTSWKGALSLCLHLSLNLFAGQTSWPTRNKFIDELLNKNINYFKLSTL
jgi:hypothetical protein